MSIQKSINTIKTSSSQLSDFETAVNAESNRKRDVLRAALNLVSGYTISLHGEHMTRSSNYEEIFVLRLSNDFAVGRDRSIWVIENDKLVRTDSADLDVEHVLAVLATKMEQLAENSKLALVSAKSEIKLLENYIELLKQ